MSNADKNVSGSSPAAATISRLALIMPAPTLTVGSNKNGGGIKPTAANINANVHD
ncbi:hypothetical protein FD19_GL001188 [Lacticaseibacillus thailandensis DSM 22698 = JCM 13996]|uniref:Uncharacterized protein n=1 Tax=Lacticaseibacillus thailandensis DSM 22698 = JCM 13996 TaxID=1423810 RepID=A0A0R2CIZ2_9LACO|nr:hypothetical protein FD19_GL001188 [Lacticaseibacillus thailandensis DSM 22698 = JCM 13996]